MTDAATARRVGAALQRLAEAIDAGASSLPTESIGRAADRAAGLEAAALALAASGCTTPAVLGHEPDGRPRWPCGHTGSIAHAGRVAVAVASRTADRRALGVDVELAGALPARDADAVLDAEERRRVELAPHPDQLATLLWSAKEAAFKAWSTATDGGLGDVDPVDIHVTLETLPDDAETAPVRVDAQGPLAARVGAIGALTGRTVRVGGYVLVLVSTGPRRGGHPLDGMASAAMTMPSAAKATT